MQTEGLPAAIGCVMC